MFKDETFFTPSNEITNLPRAKPPGTVFREYFLARWDFALMDDEMSLSFIEKFYTSRIKSRENLVEFKIIFHNFRP
jgi:hypothetical protein